MTVRSLRAMLDQMPAEYELQFRDGARQLTVDLPQWQSPMLDRVIEIDVVEVKQ